MTVKLKKSDLQQAVKEYVKKLFPGVEVKTVHYSKATKGDNVVAEVEIEVSETVEVSVTSNK